MTVKKIWVYNLYFLIKKQISIKTVKLDNNMHSSYNNNNYKTTTNKLYKD